MAAAALALALLTFFQFPGHTWLQQDSQIYVPILEHLRDPSLLRNDILARQPHVAFTLYDEFARLLRAVTGLDFRVVLMLQQIATRALGIWGLWLILAPVKGPARAVIVAIVALGASIVGPQVLTFEYEPTPRAFALPLLLCAMGLVVRGSYLGAGIAAGVAVLYHPPTAIPFCVVFAILARRRLRALAPIAAAAAIVLLAARTQAGPAEAQTIFARLTPMQEQLQRMRAGYVWISMWRTAWIVQYIVEAAVVAGAFWRVRGEASPEARAFLLGLPAIGLLSMPLSWLLLERFKWALIPQVQPLRALLFVTLSMQILAAWAAVRAGRGGRPWEAVAWFAATYLPPVYSSFTEAFPWQRVAVWLALASLTAVAVWKLPRWAPLAALAAFFAIPLLGGVVNYPSLRNPELAAVSDWARSSTPRDAVFLFADAGRGLDPGIFRSDALRAVYVDWKGGGQVNYLKDFAEQWWFRWRQTMAVRFRPSALPRYEALGITYVVLQTRNRLPRPAEFENEKYVVYKIGT
jgi:hypothetical protein